jgi:axial budding pattern protein 2
MFIVLLFLSATLVLASSSSSSSSVSVLFPLDSQLPPIARVGSSYSWKFAEGSFLSQTNASLVYSTSPLPAWLAFDPASRTFSGTPAREDEGTPRIKVLATDPKTSDFATSPVSLCITPFPAPDLAKPVAAQFRPDNPSLSSVFLLSDHSALMNTTAEIPTLRIPSSWSFSIGFDGDTFMGPDSIRYAALQADGTPLPPWMRFDPDEITLDGVAPPLHTHPTPYFLELVLHASDQFGFSAASVPFNVVVASRELHLSPVGLPKINITKSSSFDILLDSPMDFSGILVDDTPIDPHDVTSVAIDTSSYSYLHYDMNSRRLSGQLPSDSVLPLVFTALNQTLSTQLMLVAEPSFFSQDPLPSLLTTPGEDMHFSLSTFFSNATREGADLFALYDPSDAGTYLSFDTDSAILSGKIPSFDPDYTYSHITVSFTAYSRLTHSISHTSLPISLTPADYDHRKPAAGSQHHASRKRLVLGLGIALGLLGGIFGLSLLLAVFRGCAHPPDPALTGAAAARAMTENERRWYGIGQPDDGYDDAEKGYTNGRGELGLGLSRTMTMTQVSSSGDDQRSLTSPGQLSKAQFLNRIRATVRKVSNHYRPATKSSIGRPVLVQDAAAAGGGGIPATPAIPSLAGYEPVGYSGTASSLRGSPSSSTGDRSIPQRRADFAPPRPPQPTVAPAPGARRSRDSVMSLASDSSTRSHAAEAVVQRAARARSVRSVGGYEGNSTSGARARMVPFTAGRATAAGPGVPPPARASSLSASVVRVVEEADELDVGMRYVRALGEDAAPSRSFSSLESSHPARSSIGSGGRDVLRVLVRVGERFRFRLPVRAGAGAGVGGGLVARRVSGELIPAFLYADLDIARGERHRDTVKFWGVPRADDVGEVRVGVYTANGVCVAQAVIEVLVRSS